jgi:hypothetical protein
MIFELKNNDLNECLEALPVHLFKAEKSHIFVLILSENIEVNNSAIKFYELVHESQLLTDM